jgi:hypothetical protein
MPDDNNNEISPKPKRTRKTQPLVEGINTPKNSNDIIFVKPTLTDQEKKAISDTSKPEPKLLSKKAVERAGKGSGGFGSFLLWLVFFLVLGFCGYKVYVWYGQNNSTFQENTNVVVNEEEVIPTPTPEPIPEIVPTTTPVSNATTTPPANTKKLKISSTPTGFLNVREEPNTSSKILLQAKPGETYFYTQSKNGWYQITFSGLQSGWVNAQYVTLQ